MSTDLEVIGEILPLALGVAISPIPVIAVILMLLAPKARGTSLGFLIGWTKGAALGFLLSAVNPKNLMMGAAAGVATAQGGAYALPIIVFTVVAACTVAIPVIAYAVAAERMRGPLDGLRGWLAHNNATVMFVLLLVIGVLLVGKGLGGL
ncbi:GAP family protein [Thermoactinospora rubra]|uniref:GAP family protein n=1 Tax=Thermoactinospora rubra TaxID=1088767 RepID=UPI000A1184FF|nr:GAP family protein [Thermoactinospora rubra]